MNQRNIRFIREDYIEHFDKRKKRKAPIKKSEKAQSPFTLTSINNHPSTTPSHQENTPSHQENTPRPQRKRPKAPKTAPHPLETTQKCP